MKKTIKNPWNFAQPPYDQRSSCYINAGTNQGIGKTQPIGSKTVSNKLPFPTNTNKGIKVDEVPRKNLPIDIEE